MDPLALAAVVGLVFAGQRFSADSSPATTIPVKPPHQITRGDLIQADKNFAQQDSQMQVRRGDGRSFQGFEVGAKREVAAFGDMDPKANRFPFGQPVYDLYNRQNVTNK